jgi:CRISPR-associated exonuclease Cas4
MKISVSMLSTYVFCSRKLFLEKVLAQKEPIKESTVLGSLRHEIYDFINQSERKIVESIIKKLDYNDITSAYRKFYIKALREKIIKNKSRIKSVNLSLMEVFKTTSPLVLNEARARALNIFSCMQKYGVYGNELWEKVTPKLLSEIRIESEELQLYGIVDRIEIHENAYIPVELKTGKLPKDGIWPGHRIQLAAYALILEERYNTKVKEGFIKYLDANQTRHIAINPFMKEEILKLVKEIQELIKTPEIPDYCRNRNKCVKCGLKETCYNEEKIEGLTAEIQ